MTSANPIFEKTYDDYLERIRGLDLAAIHAKLGADVKDDGLIIPVFGQAYHVSARGIRGPSGKKAHLDICVILSRYLLMCPSKTLTDLRWTAFRDFKDAGPLSTYFTDNIQKPIVECFSGRLSALQNASAALNGTRPMEPFAYDFAMCFKGLPQIGLLLLFNDGDAEFPPQAFVLFERRADQHLDPECLSMLARRLAVRLNNADSLP